MLVASSETDVDITSEAQRAPRPSYVKLWREAEKPFAERQKIHGRNGDSALRKYHLTEEDKQNLLTEAAATGGIVNPLKNRVGAYWGAVEALILLGANEFHSLKKIRDKMQEVMSVIPKKREMDGGKVIDTDAWTDFYGKPGRPGAAKPKDGMGRIEQNFKVLQRLPREGKEEANSYGAKLAQFGMCIDIEYREVTPSIFLPFVRLNTTHIPWTNLDEYPQLVPLYVNPNSRRRGKKKAATEVPAIEEVKTESAVAETVATEVVVTEAVVQEVAEVKSSSDDILDEDEPKVVLPPDDFEEQQKAFEAEQQKVVAEQS